MDARWVILPPRAPVVKMRGPSAAILAKLVSLVVDGSLDRGDMTSVALFVGLFMTTVGLVGIVAPDGLLRAAHYTVTPIGLYLVAALRVSFGVVLLLAASASRAPKALRVLG